jgi:hypothetical protein
MTMTENTTKLYHATTKEAWEKIRVEGLRPTCGVLHEPFQITESGIISGPCVDCHFPAHVYMTEDKDGAEHFGSVLLEIDVSKLDPARFNRFREPLCDMLGTSDFINYRGAIPVEAIKKI